MEVPAPETALSTADLGTVPVVAVGLKDTSLRIIDLETGAERATFHLPEAVTSPAAVGADRSGVGMGLDLVSAVARAQQRRGHLAAEPGPSPQQATTTDRGGEVQERTVNTWVEVSARPHRAPAVTPTSPRHGLTTGLVEARPKNRSGRPGRTGSPSTPVVCSVPGTRTRNDGKHHGNPVCEPRRCIRAQPQLTPGQGGQTTARIRVGQSSGTPARVT